MKYHDYHIDKYEVSDRGETITFHLAYGYKGDVTDTSVIQFKNVALYNFTHTGNSILTDLYEVDVIDLVKEKAAIITEWNRMHRVNMFENDLNEFSNTLKSNGYKAWHIESAIGFYGFIIAKEVTSA